jgi:hypothetical protein
MSATLKAMLSSGIQVEHCRAVSTRLTLPKRKQRTAARATRFEDFPDWFPIINLTGAQLVSLFHKV